MKSLRVLALCVLGALAVSAFAASSAAAASALPEAGRCVKVATGTGVYRTSNCVTVALSETSKKFEWVPASALEKRTFSGAGLETTLTTSGHPTISCVTANITGEWTGPKTANVAVEFQGCTNSLGDQCQSIANPQNKSEIKTIGVEGELGFIRDEEVEGKLIVVVGLDLKPLPPVTELAEYECTGSSEVGHLEGSVIGKISPIDKMTTEQKLVYNANKNGEQQYHSFQGAPKDTLTTTFTSGLETLSSGESSLKIKEETGRNAEAFEIRAKES